ncbi:MAG TPA: hypothetical protein VGL56_18060 [Fimbriimonadaceae bacterium]
MIIFDFLPSPPVLSGLVTFVVSYRLVRVLNSSFKPLRKWERPNIRMELITNYDAPQTPNQPVLSLPNCLQQQLERAQNLLAQSENAENNGDRSLAVVKAREAMQVVQSLAQRSPEAAALIVLADMGYRGFE